MSILSPLDALRRRRPLVHCVSNIVTANDCANVLLAAGASPIMAQAMEEMAEITAGCDATVLNTGTPEGPHRWDLCRLCGQLAAAQERCSFSSASALSTPRSRLFRCSRAWASPRFTRTSVGVNASSSDSTPARRKAEAPTPTGSSTTGWWSAAAS